MLFKELRGVFFKTQNGTFTEMTPFNDGYRYRDAFVNIDDNGTVCISSEDTPVSFICLRWRVDFEEDTVFLGDHWERAYGDLKWKKIDETDIMPWYFAAKTETECRCFGVMTAPNSMCHWRVYDNEVVLYLDVRSGADPIAFHGRILEAATVVTEEYTADSMSALTDFCRKMCPNPRLVSYPIYGGDDWYCTYGFSSYESVISHTKKIAECAEGLENRPFMVIDAGWNLCCTPNKYIGGPWYPNSKFGDMKKLAEEMKKIGVRPGIWYKPLDNMEMFAPDHFLRMKGNTPDDYSLDPTKPETIAQIKKEVAQFREWGFEMIKEDFTSFDTLLRWGFEMKDDLTDGGWHFYDNSLTTAEISKNLYSAIREAAGDDIIISGCNSFNHLCAGIYEFMRTGDDTSGTDWAKTRQMGVNTLAFRMPHHNTFYSAYADCVGITKDIEWSRNKQWLDVLSKSGTPTFVSIADDSYTPEVKAAIKEAFARAAVNTVVSVPLDWETEIYPKVWKSAYGTDTYCWD